MFRSLGSCLLLLHKVIDRNKPRGQGMYCKWGAFGEYSSKFSMLALLLKTDFVSLEVCKREVFQSLAVRGMKGRSELLTFVTRMEMTQMQSAFRL